MSETNLADRDLRQREIVPPDRIAGLTATVVGIGAIGRQVAVQLSAIGVSRLKLIDFDTVDVVNLAPQGYFPGDLGQLKVEATALVCRQLNPAVRIETAPRRFTRSMPLGDVLFCCVDSIVIRQLIWEAAREQVYLFVDGRMSAEVIRVLAVGDEPARRHYPTTLFPESEAHQEACTSRSTIFTANIAAGLMVQQFTRWLRHIPTDRDLQLNLLSSEMDVISR